MERKFKIPLGAKARDKVTGYTGIVIAHTEWLYGCLRYVLQSQEMKDGKPVDSISFDEDALELIKESERKVSSRGGPTPEPRRPADPTR